MRALISILLVMLLFGELISVQAAPDSAVTNKPCLTIELQDGSRVLGRSKENTLQIHSEVLGEIELTLDKIAYVKRLANTNLAAIKAANGDTFTATITTKTIHLATSFGELRLATDSIRQLSVNTVFPGTNPGAVASWSGAGKGGDTIGGHNASLVGRVAFAPGLRGEAFFLDGASYLRVPGTPELAVGKESGLTMECWINPAKTDEQMPIIEFEQELGSRNGSDVGLQLYINLPPGGGAGRGCISANLEDTTKISHIISSPPNLLRPGIWQHIALTYDRVSGEAVIYLNGREVTAENLGSFTPESNLAYLLIGARTAFGSESRPSDAFSGGLDAIALYNRALSAPEIQSIYEQEYGGDAGRREDR